MDLIDKETWVSMSVDALARGALSLFAKCEYGAAADLGDKWFRLLYTAVLALSGCPDEQIKRADLALGPVHYHAVTDRSVLGSLRIARQDLDALRYRLPDVMGLWIRWWRLVVSMNGRRRCTGRWFGRPRQCWRRWSGFDRP